MRLFHSSDWHLSFSGDEPGKILKPMDQRTWSRGSPNYVGYLDKLHADMMALNAAPNDLLIITGDVTHDMSKKHILAQLNWLKWKLPCRILLIRGNHDHQVDFGLIRATTNDSAYSPFIFLEEGSFTCYGPFLIGCYSDHRNAWGDGQGNQPAFSNLEEDVMRMVHHFAHMAKVHKKIPIMVSHYPVPFPIAEKIGKMGIKMYLSGHVHVTSNKIEGGTDWSWYEKTAKHTDDKDIDGCFFSTGTTDVLLNKHGKMIKEVTNRVPHQLKTTPPEAQKRRFQPPKTPAEGMVVLVGLPGCGKTTYCLDSTYERISQDDLGGSKGAAIQACEKALAAGKSVVIDRVNFDEAQRKIWLDLARKYRVKTVTAVYFNPKDDRFSPELCESRVLARKGHPTINDSIPDARKADIVHRFAQKLTRPQESEGFHHVVVL